MMSIVAWYTFGYMNMIEKWFGGPKDVTTEMKQKEPEVVDLVPAEEPRTLKTMNDIKGAVGDIQHLQGKRWDTLQKHRDTIEELRKYGVNEYNPDTSPRTETVKEILNPIEDELVAISTEITEKREEFDLQPDRKEVINTRLFRLGELKHRAKKDFENTESGKKVAHIDAHIASRFQQSDLYQKEIADLKDERVEFFKKDKIANEYAITIERIEHLEVELNDMLAKSKRVGYDDNGINSVK
jgi:DNA repair ATPase RecN